MFGVFDWLKIGAGAALGAVVAGSLVYGIAYWRGNSAGYDRHVAEVAVADQKASIRRKHDDAALQSMSDYDLCVAGLGGSGMPIDACEQLRGIRGE